MTKIKEVITILENLAPLAWQESYDNAGLQTGNLNDEVKGVLITLDCTPEVIEEAILHDCNLIMAHHPVIFKPLKRLTGSNMVEQTIIKAIQHNIAIYASHTNLDSVIGGVNSKIAHKLGLENITILSPKQDALLKLVTFVPQENTEAVLQALHQAGAGQIGDYKNCSFQLSGEGRFLPTGSANPTIGQVGKPEKIIEDRLEVILPAHLQNRVLEALFKTHPYEEVAYDLYALKNANQEVGAGMIGEIPIALAYPDFLEELKQNMGLTTVKHTVHGPGMIKRVAICGGAGSFLLNDARRQLADVFITGDMKYHEFFQAEGHLHICDIGHYESEVFTKEIFYDLISENFSNFAVLLSKINTNPVRYS
ncbi:Nif3-like dinuclear metal center hexameric protein [Adhaeribacter sp. BT258]|uniref:GTP cyclohydrolase 1 type 2 homolog n=1 Tax=Adhaeribacter terrigena TaxID=2793070 RepID=A0ABS1C0V3_9BACT|nr:Nif3-like dinuclear metal center hexameric protein [Adhaeribacter terrigena]MBK0402960.1 Nif3-like dinuclear metal center hexameric protein [Adhaeribacter terrigena]